MLDEPLGLFDDHLGDLHVPLGGLVEGRRDDLPLHGALHVGDFLRPLVDEQHDEEHLGMVPRHRLRNALEQHRLAGAGGRHDQAALPLADGRHEIQDPAREVVRGGFECEPVLRIEWREVLEEQLLARLLGGLEVHRLDLDQGEISLPFFRRADLA